FTASYTTCSAVGYFALTSLINFLVVGLGIEEVKITTFLLPTALSFAITCSSNFAQEVAANFPPVFVKGPLTLSESYNDNTEACTLALVDSKYLAVLLELIRIGRPSLVFTKTFA